ncbi:MAG: beta-ketoacyl synthase N-terminal-like domain-containing protein [Pseudomonadota bacterium]
MKPIAVVGISGIFPGAGDPETFCRNIMEKQSAIIEVPPQRWIRQPASVFSRSNEPDRVVSMRAGLVQDFTFDPDGFEISPDLLNDLDPLHKLVLATGRNAFQGCFPSPDMRRRTSTILAAISLPTQTSSDLAWEILCHDRPITQNRAAAGMVTGFPAALLARAMGFGGGCLTLDAACASSLFAVKLACDQLNSGTSDMVIAGGVSRPDSLYTQIGFSQLKALSPTGRCAPFDRTADGLVVGEGAGIVVLKRLDDALACNDMIHGIITGAGWSNDIRGNLVAPASEGQVRAMNQAYASAGWSPGDIQYLECHGSGTPVGDMVELASLSRVWNDAGLPESGCALGSVKSNIGHLLTGAGAAGLIKTIQAMKAGLIPPSLNFSQPPGDSILKTGFFRVQTEPGQWHPAPLSTDPSRITRRAGVSAFGFGGINAHLLLEQAPAPGSVSQKGKPVRRPGILTGKSGRRPAAIVGMAVFTGAAQDLNTFHDQVMNGNRPEPEMPGSRWRIPAQSWQRQGLWIREVDTWAGEFHLPPNQVTDMLPQHLAMLKASKLAIMDAGISPRPENDTPERTRFGAALGIDFDYEATDFHLRWRCLEVSPDLADAMAPPLNDNRTLGALGGIVASRIAREFKLGGPCFTVSAGECSGLKTLEIGLNSLDSGETDMFLCGSVDMAGDIRQLMVQTTLDAGQDFPKSQAGHGEPGPVLSSEGAAAVLLKPLDLALKDNDRIYAVISGTGCASGGELAWEPDNPGIRAARALSDSLDRCLNSSGTSALSLGLYLIHNPRNILEGSLEITALDTAAKETCRTLQDPGKPETHLCFLGSTAITQGNSRAISGLLSIIHAALALHTRCIPGVPPGLMGMHPARSGCRVPDRVLPWTLPPGMDTRRAMIAAMTPDGACSHVILQEAPGEKPDLVNGPVGKALLLPGSSLEINRPAKTPILLYPGRSPLSDDTLARIRSLAVQDRSRDLEKPGQDPNGNHGYGMIHLHDQTSGNFAFPGFPDTILDAVKATASAHELFLTLTQDTMKAVEEQVSALAGLAGLLDPMYQNQESDLAGLTQEDPAGRVAVQEPPDRPGILFNRDMCLEFARGSVSRVLGPRFQAVDTYPVRVRLPDEPLMLVDRILSIQGEMLSMSSGRIVTQHDVLSGAWYLDGGKAPVSITIEAGQADLFLCSWLGIDHAVMGKRRYRLLDARVTFHRTLPEPGETIEYHIEIDRFLKQGDSYLFFFHYRGYIGQKLLISMRDGCAGFFTLDEVAHSGGIILKKEDTAKDSRKSGYTPLIPLEPFALDDSRVQALRQGDLETGFGQAFLGKTLGAGLRLPGGRMHLLDRVTAFDPHGGRFGLGSILAEADIHPDHWFLTCHFVDDMVMPGTLMYECCAHTLRIFTQGIGWISDRDDVHYDVIPGLESDLKCRGPVTTATRKAGYHVEIKALGYDPEPFVIADAHMFSDGHRIVWYRNMGMKLAGLSRREIETTWS